MLVTSRETRRWIIPKGWPIKGVTPGNLAALEAMVSAEAESGADDEYLRAARAAIAKARGGK